MLIGLGIGIPFRRNYVGSATFSPGSLFANNEQGVWYDPSDMTTLFQDAAGTLPVTAVEQPVGLMLDKSKGLVLGPELVTNGDFSAGTTGWTGSSATLSVSNGALVVTPVSGNGTAYQAITTVIGKTYVITTTLVTNSGTPLLNWGTTTAFAGGSQLNLAGYPSGSSVRFQFTATTTTTYVGFTCNPAYGTNIYDNISVRELPGNHAFNSSGNSANFPVLSARVNLLTKTEDISAADWTKAGTVTASTSSLFETATTGTHSCYLSPTTVAATYIYSVKLKANGRTRLAIAGTSSFGGNLGSGVFFDLGTGSYVSGATGTPSITALADDWYQVSYTWTAFAASGVLGIFLVDSGTNISYSGDVTKGMLIKEVDLRVVNDGINLPSYQRVNTATDYDTVGFKPYLSFNGTNQWLQTNSIDFSYSDKMFVCAGVRKLSDAAAYSLIAETSTSAGFSNPGSFGLFAPAAAGTTTYHAAMSGSTAASTMDLSSYSAPISNVISLSLAIVNTTRADAIKPRVNQLTPTISGGLNTAPGIGNFRRYPIYIGARAGTSLWFNGRLYGMVIVGKQASSNEIQDTEKYLNNKTAAYN